MPMVEIYTPAHRHTTLFSKNNNLIMKTTIEIRGLRIYSHHGCYEEERRVGTNFIIDADLEVDATRAVHTDNVDDALNYVDVCQTIAEVMKEPHHILEALVADTIVFFRERYAHKGLIGGWLRISKVNPPIGLELDSVGVKTFFTIGEAETEK